MPPLFLRTDTLSFVRSATARPSSKRTTHGGETRPSPLQVDDDVSAVALALTSDERVLVIVGHSTGRVVAGDLESGHMLAEFKTPQVGGVTAIAAGPTPDGHMIVATADESGTVQVWDLANQTEISQPIRGSAAGWCSQPYRMRQASGLSSRISRRSLEHSGPALAATWASKSGCEAQGAA